MNGKNTKNKRKERKFNLRVRKFIIVYYFSFIRVLFRFLHLYYNLLPKSCLWWENVRLLFFFSFHLNVYVCIGIHVYRYVQQQQKKTFMMIPRRMALVECAVLMFKNPQKHTQKKMKFNNNWWKFFTLFSCMSFVVYFFHLIIFLTVIHTLTKKFTHSWFSKQLYWFLWKCVKC